MRSFPFLVRLQRARGIDSPQVKTAVRGLRLQPLVICLSFGRPTVSLILQELAMYCEAAHKGVQDLMLPQWSDIGQILENPSLF